MSELPKGWAECRLSDVAELNPSLDRCPYPADAAVHFVAMPAVEAETGKMDIGSTRAFSDVRKGYTAFVEGDVLFAKITPCMENGKMAVVPPLPLQVACGSTEFQVLRPRTDISPKYIYHFVSSKAFRYEAEANMTGAVGQKRVPSSFLTEHSIPLPPSAEQHRIVAKIEELFSELDASEESLTRARAQLGLYRQSLLKAAFQGTLTADWRAANPDKLEAPEALLARIRKEREDRYRQALEDWQTALSEWRAKGEVGRKPQKPERPAAVQLYSDISRAPTLPDGWAWFTTESAGKVETGNTPPTKNSEFFNGDVPFFKPSDLDAGYTSNQSRDHLTQLGSEVSRTFPAGSVLVTCIGATIGKTGRATIGGACNQQINFIVPDGATLSEFIFFQIVGPAFQEQIKDNASSTTLPILNKGKFCALPFAICALDEQVEIVAILAQRLSVIDSIETEITSALAKITALRQSILKKAFAGELVPQDPADEPAAALLARIRAEAPMSSPRRKKSA